LFKGTLLYVGKESNLNIRSALVCALVGCLMLVSIACPAAWAENYKPFPLRDFSEYVDARAQLQALVNTMGFHSVNHFCIVGYQGPEIHDFSGFYVYWPTQDKFIIWDGGTDTILDSVHYWDLRRDILPDSVAWPPQDIMLPWHQADIEAVLRDCRIYGNAFTIKKTVGGWVPISKFRAFSTIQVQLQFLVDHEAVGKSNRFCVVGQKDGPFLGAYVYWQTQETLILWTPSPYDIYDPFAVAGMPVQIDLKHDLRDQEDDYYNRHQMQRLYAESILRACRTLGENFIIRKTNWEDFGDENSR